MSSPVTLPPLWATVTLSGIGVRVGDPRSAFLFQLPDTKGWKYPSSSSVLLPGVRSIIYRKERKESNGGSAASPVMDASSVVPCKIMMAALYYACCLLLLYELQCSLH